MTGMADKRIRMTKRMLAEQLIEAASVRDFDDISISEICEKAGVSRVTFYKYYRNLKDLMDETAASALQQIHPETADRENTEEIIRRILHNRALYKVLIEKGYCEEAFSTYLKNTVRNSSAGNPDEEILQLQAQYAACGLCGMIHDCLKEDCDITPKKLSGMVLRFYESWKNDVYALNNL